MFERFTDRAREVVTRSQAEARRLEHDKIGTEHILLALLADDAGLAAMVLREAGADADDLRARILRHVGRGPRVLGEADAAALREIGIDLDAVRAKIEAAFGPGALEPPEDRPKWGLRRGRRRGWPFSSRAKKVLELSLREALRLKHRHIGTEHILLGLVREGEGLAALVLTEAGLDLDDLRRRVEAAVRAAA
ncbi:Clp amino terminal domain-containing protein, pathogenicity island component [Micromonospora pattaloongensis]|uniref:Clp amino terminal domain-containing protein, pathogenicity island component n=1 Tax=Micromonospora pattaloongensis TaxID=405436 RepID=A0A1H3JHZ9_9ACTN|nr:Clp protease N-terminal domain-containing protein [Micromonospora pattaloongensis]SDY39542.1 Clp amino terminal domain-containing protein, pathogenicity island component [Micromonospora pattaloongensis]